MLLYEIILALLASRTPFSALQGGLAQAHLDRSVSRSVRPGPEAELAPAKGENASPEEEAEIESALPEGGDDMTRSVYVAVYSLLIALIIVGNVTAVFLILRSRTLRADPNNLYLMSLLLARSCVGFFVVPARITGKYSAEYLGSALCKLCHCIAAGSAAATVLSIVAVALMRLATVRGQKSGSTTSAAGVSSADVRRAWWRIAMLWALSFLYAVHAPIIFDITVRHDDGDGDRGALTAVACDISAPFRWLMRYLAMIELVVLFVLPLSVSLYCYAQVIANHAAQAYASGGQPDVARRHVRGIEMLVILLVLFIVCSLLPLAMRVYILWGGRVTPAVPTTEEIFYIVSYSNAWLNLVVFWYFRPDLRAQLVHFIECCRSRITNGRGVLDVAIPP